MSNAGGFTTMGQKEVTVRRISKDYDQVLNVRFDLLEKVEKAEGEHRKNLEKLIDSLGNRLKEMDLDRSILLTQLHPCHHDWRDWHNNLGQRCKKCGKHRKKKGLNIKDL